MGNTIFINYNNTTVTTFLRVYKVRGESSGLNTEGGLSGPELEMLKAGVDWPE